MAVVERAGREHRGHALLAQRVGVGSRDRAADEHEHVVGALAAQQLEDAGHERHVRAREDRDADGVGILLDDRLDDLLGRLVQPRIDDFHACIAKSPCDDLCSAIVAIEPGLRNDHADPACHRSDDRWPRRSPSGGGARLPILYAWMSVTDRTDPYEIIGVRRDASLAEIRISYRRSTQILAPERFASANDTVRAEAARRLAALNSAMESIEAERAAESGSALGSLSFGGPAVAPAAEPSMRSTAVVDEPPPLTAPAQEPEPQDEARPWPTSPTASRKLAPTGAPEPEAEAAPSPAPEPEPPSRRAGAGARAAVPAAEPSRSPRAARRSRAGRHRGRHPPAGRRGHVRHSDRSSPSPREPAPTPQPVAACAGPAPRRPERPTRKAPRKRSLMPRILAASAVVAGAAAVAAYFLLSGGSSKPSVGQFQGATRARELHLSERARGTPATARRPAQAHVLDRSRPRTPPTTSWSRPTGSPPTCSPTARPSARAAAASPPIASTSRSIAPPSASPPPRSSRRRARSSPARPAT